MSFFVIYGILANKDSCDKLVHQKRANMNFRELCNNIRHSACVISVEKVDGGYGEIRIVDGNDAYLDSFKTENYTKREFIPNSLYTDYLMKNLNFEEYSYRSAVKKELLHSYAYPEYFKAWMHMLFIPLSYETKELSYCLYIMEINDEFNAELLAHPRGDIYGEVLNTTLQLSNTTDFHTAINNVTQEVRKICNALFCCILLRNKDNGKLDVLAEDREPHSDKLPMSEYMDERFYESVKSWDNLIAFNGNCIIISDQKGMDYIKEQCLTWYESLVESNIHSLVLFPLKSGNEIIGYMWVSDFKTDDVTQIKEALEITAFVLGSQIANKLLLDQLTRLSSIDLLTGLYNRNKLNAYMSGVVESEKTPIGLVFLDINGLKQVHDQQGHLAGDDLIKRAAKVLNKIYEGNDIFRVGGDEFVVILIGAQEKEIVDGLDRLYLEAERNDVSFAAGYALTDNAGDIEKALNAADFAMYKNKRKFYGK